MEYTHVKHTFLPVYNEESRILILGSFPSVKSRENQFYYGHPQNRFWKVIAGIFKEPLPQTIDEKKDLLLRHRIAVWADGGMENGIWNVFRNNRIEDEEQHRKGINLKKEEMTNMDFLLEAVGIVAAMIYLGLQIYYGIVYGVAFTGIILNAAILILVYVGLTLLARYPERVNNLPKEICSGKIRKYTIHMVRAVKLIFVLSLLFTSICDVAGVQINKGYSLVTVALIVIVTVVYEGKIIKLLRGKK